MSETHVSHTKPCSRMRSLSESRGESKVRKPIFSNSGKRYSPITSPRGAYIWGGDLTEGFLRYRFRVLYLEGLILGILRHVTIISRYQVSAINHARG